MDRFKERLHAGVRELQKAVTREIEEAAADLAGRIDEGAEKAFQQLREGLRPLRALKRQG